MTDGETVMSIKLKKSSVKGIFTSSGSGGRIIKPSVTRKSTSGSVVDVSVSPDKFFNGVVKVKGNIFGVSRSTNRFSTGKLNLFDKVFVANLGESTTFISIKIDVVNIEFASKTRCDDRVGINIS